MATIRKIKNSKKGSYQIIVSNGYDAEGKQIRVTTTFTPDADLTEEQKQKQVWEFADGFESQIKTKKKKNIKLEPKIPTMLTIDKLAKKTGFSTFSIRKMVRENRIVYVKAGRKVLINYEKFLEYLNIGDR